METQVVDLLRAEEKVNKMVRDALDRKRQKLETLQAHTDEEVRLVKDGLEQKLNEQVA